MDVNNEIIKCKDDAKLNTILLCQKELYNIQLSLLDDVKNNITNINNTITNTNLNHPKFLINRQNKLAETIDLPEKRKLDNVEIVLLSMMDNNGKISLLSHVTGFIVLLTRINTVSYKYLLL